MYVNNIFRFDILIEAANENNSGEFRYIESIEASPYIKEFAPKV